MGWWDRVVVGMWSGSANWLPISQLGLCFAMGASRIVSFAGGDGDGIDLAFAIGWGVFAAWWLTTLAGFLVAKRRITNVAPTPEGDQ